MRSEPVALSSARFAAHTSEVVDAMRILVFGQSNTLGAQLAPGEVGWPRLLELALPGVLGRAVEVTVRPFYAHAAGAAEYLDRELKRHPADVIIATTTPFAFLEPMVGPGVRRRYGERAGNAYQWLESRFDRVTRHGGPTSHRLNRAARRLSHAILGAAPITSYEVVIDGMAEAFQRLAREEHVQVIALQGVVQVPGGSARARAARRALLRRYLAETRAAAERLHIVYISLMDVSEDAPFLPDGMHYRASGHQSVCDAVVAAFRDGRLRVE